MVPRGRPRLTALTADDRPGIVDVPEQWLALVTCRDEKQQVELLERFRREGVECRRGVVKSEPNFVPFSALYSLAVLSPIQYPKVHCDWSEKEKIMVPTTHDRAKREASATLYRLLDHHRARLASRQTGR